MNEVQVKVRYFCYDQNNSGGDFRFDDQKGISAMVIVAARDAREADNRAEQIGLYFDGAGDCGCCGDRWYQQYGDGYDTPMIYESMDIEQWTTIPFFVKWMGPDRPEVYVHEYDGTFTGLVYGEPGNIRMRSDFIEGEIVTMRELES